jgi:hypothetical protein
MRPSPPEVTLLMRPSTMTCVLFWWCWLEVFFSFCAEDRPSGRQCDS